MCLSCYECFKFSLWRESSLHPNPLSTVTYQHRSRHLYADTVKKRKNLSIVFVYYVTSSQLQSAVRLSMFSELNVSTLNLYHDECTMYIVQCTYCSLLAFHSRELSKMYRYMQCVLGLLHIVKLKVNTVTPQVSRDLRSKFYF